MVWDWARKMLRGNPAPKQVELKARQVKLPVLDNYPIQHLSLQVMGMREGGYAGAPGFVKVEGDTLTIVIWDSCLLTPLQEQVGFAVTYEMKKGMVREIGADLAEELLRKPSW